MWSRPYDPQVWEAGIETLQEYSMIDPTTGVKSYDTYGIQRNDQTDLEAHHYESQYLQTFEVIEGLKEEEGMEQQDKGIHSLGFYLKLL